MTPTLPRSDSAETRRLLDLCVRDDPGAVNALLGRYRDNLHTFIEGRLDPAIRARIDPSDVLQEALVEAARRLPDYVARRPMPFHLWVRKTAYERLLNIRRDHRAACRDVAREAMVPAGTSVALARSLVSRGPSPSAVVEARELADRVAAVVEELPEPDREILLLRQVDGLPYEEVAVLLDIDPAAARQRYGRALLRLQKVLREQRLLGDSP